jgi:hypothetical protein
MLGDAVSAKQAAGEAKETLQVIDVAQLLVRSVAAPAAVGAAANGSAAAADSAAPADGDPAGGDGIAGGAGGTSPRTGS